MVAHTGKVKFSLQEPVFLSNWSRQGKNERPSTSLNNGLQICMSLERTPSPCSRATSLVDCRAHGTWLAQASATEILFAMCLRTHGLGFTVTH